MAPCETAPHARPPAKPVQQRGAAHARSVLKLKAEPKQRKASVRMVIGDCRERLPEIKEVKEHAVRLVFADPPFNWGRDYDRQKTGKAWGDKLATDEYLAFTRQWLDLCIDALTDDGSIWVNIPDDWAAEIVMHCKGRGLAMVNWCIWHYRFGQNTSSRFINSKVHALYFAKDKTNRIWHPERVLEESDRRAIYNDPRTETKKQGTAGMRVPMDVWYGPFWGRIQGNNKERRHNHDNQLPERYLERVILACSEEGDTVLDPFIGSGTTAVVARAYGRHFIGTEFNEETARSAFERCRDVGMVRKGTGLGQSTAIYPKRSD